LVDFALSQTNEPSDQEPVIAIQDHANLATERHQGRIPARHAIRLAPGAVIGVKYASLEERCDGLHTIRQARGVHNRNGAHELFS
jgi:hypothetical protein